MAEGRATRVGISGSYGGLNLGDEAILSGILKELGAVRPAELTVFTRNVDDTRARHPAVHAVPVRDLTREESRAEIERLDLFILGGGGILYDRDAEVYLREVAIAHEAGVPVVIYAISAGPLKDPAARELVARQLNRAAAVTVRDRQAIKLLEEVGVEREITLTADPALLLEAEELPADALKREGLDGYRRLVGFSVREPGPAAPDMDVEHYQTLLASAADFMAARFDAGVVFVPMEAKKADVQQSHAIVSRMEHAQRATVLKGVYTPGQLVSLIGHFEFAVGMRLHFLIFSALAGVPFVALPYASKVLGFVQDLEMPMPPLADVTTGGLIAHIDRSWDTRRELGAKMVARIPELQERARQTNRIVLGVLDARAAEPVAKEP